MKLEKTNSINKTKICEGRVSESTLNKAYEEIKNYFDTIIPEDYKDKIQKCLLTD